MNMSRMKFPYLTALVFAAACSVGENSDKTQPQIPKEQANDVQQTRPVPSVEIRLTNDSVTSLETIAELDYRAADFVSVIRCNANYDLISATGEALRHSSGFLAQTHYLDLRVAWESALGATEFCRLLGDKVVRQSFSDPSAETGRYFYLFNPCHETISQDAEREQIHCSYRLRSTRDITLRGTLSEENFKRAQEILKYEAKLAATAIKFRQQLQMSLYAQESCENNQTVDAIREAKQKALKSLLITGIAAAIGGVVGGPEAGAEAAKKTLKWIADYYGPGTVNNPTRCKQLDDADSKAREVAAEMELLTKKISQLRKELADSQKTF
ncbi:MAG: hypothetical protein RLZZ488_1443 [Pseudomonadota bacterium]